PRGSGAREVGGVDLGAAGALTGVPVALRGGRGDDTAFGHGTVVMGDPDLTDRAFGDIGEDRRAGRQDEGLAFEQLIGEVVEHIAVARHRPRGSGVGGIDGRAHFAIYRGQGRVPVLIAAAVAASGEELVLVVADLDHAQLLAHAVLGDHLAGDVRRLL